MTSVRVHMTAGIYCSRQIKTYEFKEEVEGNTCLLVAYIDKSNQKFLKFFKEIRIKL